MIAEWVPLLLQHREQLLQHCQDLGVVINMEESDFKLSSMAQYLRMLIDTIREGLPDGLSDCQISGFGGQVPSSPGSYKDVVAVAWPHGFPGTVRSQGSKPGCALFSGS